MNRTLWEVLEKLCVGGTQILERFAMEHTMLVAILHNHIGTEVGERERAGERRSDPSSVQ